MIDLLALAKADALAELLSSEADVDGCDLLVVGKHAALLNETTCFRLAGRKLAGQQEIENCDLPLRERASSAHRQESLSHG